MFGCVKDGDDVEDGDDGDDDDVSGVWIVLATGSSPKVKKYKENGKINSGTSFCAE